MRDDVTTNLLKEYDQYVEDFGNQVYGWTEEEGLICSVLEDKHTTNYGGVDYEGKLVYIYNGNWKGLLLEDGTLYMYNGLFGKHSKLTNWVWVKRKDLTEDSLVVRYLAHSRSYYPLKIKAKDFGYWYDSNKSEVAF